MKQVNISELIGQTITSIHISYDYAYVADEVFIRTAEGHSYILTSDKKPKVTIQIDWVSGQPAIILASPVIKLINHLEIKNGFRSWYTIKTREGELSIMWYGKGDKKEDKFVYLYKIEHDSELES